MRYQGTLQHRLERTKSNCTGPKWWAYCSCNWSGGPYWDGQSAVAAHQAHVQQRRKQRI